MAAAVAAAVAVTAVMTTRVLFAVTVGSLPSCCCDGDEDAKNKSRQGTERV